MDSHNFSVCKLNGSGIHIFVVVVIETIKCRFLIDTGASHSVIDKSFYEKKLGRKLKVIKQETTGLHSTVMESFTGSLKVMEVGKLVVKKYAIPAVDLSHVNSTYKKLKKPAIQGIIGSDLLMKYAVVIDYGNWKLFF